MKHKERFQKPKTVEQQEKIKKRVARRVQKLLNWLYNHKKTR